MSCNLLINSTLWCTGIGPSDCHTINLQHTNIIFNRHYSMSVFSVPCKVPHLLCSETIHYELYYYKSCVFVCYPQIHYYIHKVYDINTFSPGHKFIRLLAMSVLLQQRQILTNMFMKVPSQILQSDFPFQYCLILTATQKLLIQTV